MAVLENRGTTQKNYVILVVLEARLLALYESLFYGKTSSRPVV